MESSTGRSTLRGSSPGSPTQLRLWRRRYKAPRSTWRKPLDILVGDKFRMCFEELDSEENLSRFVITTVRRGLWEEMREPGPGRQSASPYEMFVLTEYYIHAGYARGNGDMLAMLTVTHHRVVDQGHTKVGRKE